MPGRDNIGRKRDRKAKVVDSGLTPIALGRHLKNDHDLVILGEVHVGTVDRMNAKILEGLDPAKIYHESPPSSAGQYLSRDATTLESNWGKVSPDGVLGTALKNGTIIRPVDIEHCRHEISVQAFARIARRTRGEAGELSTCLGYAIAEAKLNGIDIFARKWPETKDPSELVDWLLNQGGSSISKFNQEACRDAAIRFERSKKGGWKADAANALDHLLLDVAHQFRASDLDLRNQVMAENIANDLAKISKDLKGRVVVHNCGSNHNDGIERVLEEEGLRVANVKADYTRFSDLHGKVFFNRHPNLRDGAEWVVAVYDPEMPQGSCGFDSNYSVTSGESGKRPTEIGATRSGPKSKQ